MLTVVMWQLFRIGNVLVGIRTLSERLNLSVLSTLDFQAIMPKSTCALSRKFHPNEATIRRVVL